MKNIVTIKEIKKELEKLEKLEKIADSAAIVELSENKINIATARSIVSGKREKLKAILKF